MVTGGEEVNTTLTEGDSRAIWVKERSGYWQEERQHHTHSEGLPLCSALKKPSKAEAKNAERIIPFLFWYVQEAFYKTVLQQHSRRRKKATRFRSSKVTVLLVDADKGVPRLITLTFYFGQLLLLLSACRAKLQR